MKVFHGFSNLPAFKSPVVTVGSYDGVHTGHRILTERVRTLAGETDAQSVVVTFSPHPREVLDTEGVKLLNTQHEKALLLDAAGMDAMIVVPFSNEFSRIQYRDFMRDYLVGQIGMKNFVAGYNHHFGADKQGGPGSVAALADELGFGFHPVERHDVGDAKVSSTVVRELIGQGNLIDASQLLGYNYFMLAALFDDCSVDLGNPNKLLPPAGVYDIVVRLGTRLRLSFGTGAVTMSESDAGRDAGDCSMVVDPTLKGAIREADSDSGTFRGKIHIESDGRVRLERDLCKAVHAGAMPKGCDVLFGDVTGAQREGRMASVSFE